ncbi:MAG: dinitrogenase iron-molybdenum cofactor biosynthesis protein, partial [Gammaproteobacteria bacterium]
ALKEAVRILWGESEGNDLPQTVDLAEPMPDSIRVAIASNTGESLNGHFGSCLYFLVYQVSANDCQLIDIRSTAGADDSDDRNAFRASLIDDCQVLYVVSIGGPAAAKVVRTGIYPIKQIDGGEAREVIARLQQVMSGSPPPWLAKILGVDAESRVRFIRSEASA